MAYNIPSDKINKAFDVLSHEAQRLYLENEVHVVDNISSLEFQRDFVGPNMPVLIKGAVKNWPAVKNWTMEFFLENLGQKEITAIVTPNGYGDTIATRYYVDRNQQLRMKEYFVLPEERIMLLSSFVNILQKRIRCPGVFSLEYHKSDLTEHFQELLPDIALDLPWASEAFNARPEEANLWISDCLAATAMHNDPHENIFCVVSGHKDFVLHPPTDRPWIPYKKYPVGIYKEITPGVFDILPHKLQSDREIMAEGIFDTLIKRSKHVSHSKHSRVRLQNMLANNRTVEGFLSYINNLDIEDDIKKLTRNLVDSYVRSSETVITPINLTLKRANHIVSQDIIQETEDAVALSGNQREFENREDESEGSSRNLNVEIYRPISSEEQDLNADNTEQDEIEDEEDTVLRISVDPVNPDFETYPQYRNATCIRVRVKAGDALYLPSLWYHHIRQSHACIAVNFLYGMKFDVKFAYFKMLESLMIHDTK